MKIAAAAGISFSECRKMTPAEILIYAEAFAERQRQIAYLQGLVIRNMVGSISVKRAPTYEDLYGISKPENEQMGDADIFQAVMAMNFAFGGENTFTGKEVS